MKNNLKTHKNLDIWSEGIDLVVMVYEIEKEKSKLSGLIRYLKKK